MLSERVFLFWGMGTFPENASDHRENDRRQDYVQSCNLPKTPQHIEFLLQGDSIYCDFSIRIVCNLAKEILTREQVYLPT